MFHLVAWSESIATGVEDDLLPVPDGIMTIQNNHFLPGQDVRVLFASAMATNLQRARIATPKVQVVTTPFIRGIMAGLVPTSPAQLATYLSNPFVLRGIEEIQVLATQTAAGAQRVTALMGLELTPNMPVSGDIFTIRGTSTTAAVANAWTPLTVTWQNTLPAGQYDIVGLQHQSANGQACRLSIEGERYRPGCMSQTGIADIAHPYFFKAAMGRWASFNNYVMPIPEVLCNAADAAHEIYLDIIRR
jgi:hypothetical protein